MAVVILVSLNITKKHIVCKLQVNQEMDKNKTFWCNNDYWDALSLTGPINNNSSFFFWYLKNYLSRKFTVFIRFPKIITNANKYFKENPSRKVLHIIKNNNKKGKFF